MKWSLLLLLAIGCEQPITDRPHGDGGVKTTDMSAVLPAHCPCPLGAYCDLATNSCTLGCLGNDQCPKGQLCDTSVYACVAFCDTDADCPPNVGCDDSGKFPVCGGCRGNFGDCNHDPADGCETPLDTDANCGGCGMAPTQTCYQDQDRDGYVVTAHAATRCQCLPTERPLNQTFPGEDCDDNDGRVHPGQTQFFDKPTETGGWDFNCDGVVEMYTQRKVFHGCGDACDAGVMWTDSAPACGVAGALTQCLLPIGGSCHTVQDTPITQTCR